VDSFHIRKTVGLLRTLSRYTYDSCDTGILPNQTWSNGTGPWAALKSGGGGSTLSYLPGHRWASCTCPGYENEHPGPNINTGRNVPEIDLVEAQIEVSRATGQVSQSFQVAPFNGYYKIDNSSIEVQDDILTSMNSYWGGQYQQAASYLTDVNSDYYRDNSDDYGVFAFEMMGTNYLRLDRLREVAESVV
jgi:beta-glucanase (GH16 family)